MLDPVLHGADLPPIIIDQPVSLRLHLLVLVLQVGDVLMQLLDFGLQGGALGVQAVELGHPVVKQRSVGRSEESPKRRGCKRMTPGA